MGAVLPRARAALALLVAGAALLAIAPAGAQQGLRGETGHLTWEAEPGATRIAARLTRETDEMLERAHRWLGLDRGRAPLPEPRRGHLIWVRDRTGIAAYLGRDEVPEWWAAVALPMQGVMVVAAEIPGGEPRLRTTLRHEIVHHAMGALGPEAFDRIPAWFHEGLADTFGGDVYLGEMGVSLSWRAASGALSPLDRFEDGFPDDGLGAAEGYALGHAFVQRLIRVHGLPIIGEILDEVRAGSTFDAALIATTGSSVVTHEAALHAELTSLRALLADGAPHVITFLFLLAAFLIPLALRRRRRRARELEARWQAQEDQAAAQAEARRTHADAMQAWLERENARARRGRGGASEDERPGD